MYEYKRKLLLSLTEAWMEFEESEKMAKGLDIRLLSPI